MKNKIEISLEEYKELLLGTTTRDIDKILLEKIIDFIKDNCKVDKVSYSGYKVDGIRLEFQSYGEKDLLNLIKYIDSTTFMDIYKYVTDKDYKKQCDDLKMERLRNIKGLKQELESKENE